VNSAQATSGIIGVGGAATSLLALSRHFGGDFVAEASLSIGIAAVSGVVLGVADYALRINVSRSFGVCGAMAATSVCTGACALVVFHRPLSAALVGVGAVLPGFVVFLLLFNAVGRELSYRIFINSIEDSDN